MDIRLVDTPKDLERLRETLPTVRRIALDCEAAGFHRFSDRLCLVQLTAGDRNYLLDPLAVPIDEVLRPILEDTSREVVMHGADFDMRLLDRDLGIRPRRLFDTQIAATLLGVDGIGLAALLDRYLGIRLSKKYQRADWAVRPIPDEMQEYAAHDTAHLLELADLLGAELERVGRMAWAEEEFEALAEIRYQEPEPSDPVLRIRAAREMTEREVHRLRVALEWRETIARRRDRAMFRIAGDAVLSEIALQNPRSMSALESVPGLNRSLAREEGEALLRRLEAANRLPDHEVEGLPAPEFTGRGRPAPEVEERFQRLKDIRNLKSTELGIERGSLIPNATLNHIAESQPRSLNALESIPGMRRWQIEVLGAELLDALRGERASAAGGTP
jgi:ribonuclease D